MTHFCTKTADFFINRHTYTQTNKPTYRLLGASPETTEDEIKQAFLDVGIGTVIEIKKGFLDEKRLPGCTNGTWSLCVKISDPDKSIPSYIHRRDEGELWSLNFEGRIFCCWKCGSNNHIGDKCRDQTRTFDEVFNDGGSDKPTWAAVVRSGQGQSELQRQKVKEMEEKLKAENRKRSLERLDQDRKAQLQTLEKEARQAHNHQLRESSLRKAHDDARENWEVFKIIQMCPGLHLYL